MQRAASVLLLAGCIERDPDFVPYGSTTGSSSSEGSGTETSSGTDATDGTGGTDETETGPTCEPPEEACGGRCVDPQIDPNHCGSCFHKCHPAMEQCADGECVPK